MTMKVRMMMMASLSNDTPIAFEGAFQTVTVALTEGYLLVEEGCLCVPPWLIVGNELTSGLAVVIG